MHDFTELDRNISLDKPEKYNLSIQLMRDGFSYSILETYIGRYVGAKHYQFRANMYFDDYLEKISRILSNDELLSTGYGGINLMVVSGKAILIPEDIFNEKDIKEHYILNENLEDLEEIHYNFIPYFKTYNVFSSHHELLNLFRSKYQDINIYHQRSSILNMKELEVSSSGLKIYVNFTTSFFDLIIVKENKLIFCNSFIYSSENDFIFYLLNTLKQLKLNDSGCEILIIGNIENKGRYFDLLRKFINDFEIGDMGDEFSFSPSLKNVSNPFLYNLYNLYRCVLLEANTGA